MLVQQVIVYVSSNLSIIDVEIDGTPLMDDIFINGICYRKLDADYYCWLYHMTKRALDASAIKVESKIQIEHAWGALVSLVRANGLFAGVNPLGFDTKKYIGPKNATEKSSSRNTNKELIFAFPLFSQVGEAELPFFQRVGQAEFDKVEAIEKEAYEKGWLPNQLYQNRGATKCPVGNEWGLVSVLSQDDSIVRVEKDYIEIETGFGKFKSKFYKR